jgi:hypothetical protein
MATLVVGPFYLSGAFALDAARVGLVMSSGPIVAALTGVLAGRVVELGYPLPISRPAGGGRGPQAPTK